MHQLIELLQSLGTPQVVLLGDFMLDRYVYGDTERISPEAPVPILRTVRSESRPGGAANVAANIFSLGGKVTCIGVLGQDASGQELHRLLTAAGRLLPRLPMRSPSGSLGGESGKPVAGTNGMLYN